MAGASRHQPQPWRQYLGLFCAAALGLLAGARPANAVEPQVTDEQVTTAMNRGIDFLLAQKKADNWENAGGAYWLKTQSSGQTCLVLYALLHAGESLDDRRLRPKSDELAPVVKHVTQLTPETTYAAAFQVCALSLVRQDDPDIRKAVARALTTLAAASRQDGGQTYSPAEARQYPKPWDASNTQYAVLAFWAAAEARHEVPQSYWRAEDRFWRSKQKADGGWPYSDVESKDGRIYRDKSNPPMNVAGLASLYITRDMLNPELSLTPKPDPALNAALARVAEDFRPDSQDYYYLYGLERVALASGLKFVGPANWYKAVAAELVKHQSKDGSWTGRFVDANIGGESEIVSTAYALLTLARGRNPVVFNKLQYGGKDSRWDARPRDSANLTAWMSRTFEKPINWQVVNSQVSAEEWADAPVLLITGSNDPRFTPEEIQRLQAFVNAGGLIFSTADAGDKAFTDAIRKIYAPAVGGNKSEMRELPEDHFIFSKDLWTKVANPPKILGLSNGVRELWIHSTVDLGAAWQMRRNVQQSDYFSIPANVFFYATGRGSLRNKLQSLVIAPPKTPPTRKIALGRLEYAGNWDPEPAAWPRMAKLAAADFHTDLILTPVKLDKLDPKEQPIVHMTGTAAFTLTEDQVKQLRAYLDAGGTLFADAAGGSPAFTDSFIALTKLLYPQQGLAGLALNHPVYNGAVADTIKADVVEFRKYNQNVQGPSSTPRLQAVIENGRAVVIFSSDDLTHGLLGSNTWGILGYQPASAQALVRNVLLVAATPPGATQPASAPAATEGISTPPKTGG